MASSGGLCICFVCCIDVFVVRTLRDSHTDKHKNTLTHSKTHTHYDIHHNRETESDNDTIINIKIISKIKKGEGIIPNNK